MTTHEALETLRTGEGWDMQLESIWEQTLEAVNKRREFMQLIEEISKKEIIQISSADYGNGKHVNLDRSWNQMFSFRQFANGKNASDITEIILVECNPDKNHETYVMKYGDRGACFVTVKK